MMFKKPASSLVPFIHLFLSLTYFSGSCLARPLPESETFRHGLDEALHTLLSIPAALAATPSTEFTKFTDWTCQLTEEHPYPVILLHGLIAPQFTSWQFLAENLKQRGYCVYQFRYGMIPGFPGIGGLTDIQDSAHQLGDYVDKVLASTTASKVDLVGHSEGTVVSRWYAKFLDNQKVRSVVSVSPIGQGTTIQGLLGFSKLVGWYDILANAVHGLCAACTQLLEGSDLLSQLYYTKAGSAEYGSGSDLVPHVQYLSILTNQDQLVTPYTNGLLSIPEAPKGDESTASSTSRMELDPVYSSKNLVLEDYCGMDPEHSNHFGLFQSPFALNAIDAFLTPPSQGQGDSGRPNENWACS